MATERLSWWWKVAPAGPFWLRLRGPESSDNENSLSEEKKKLFQLKYSLHVRETFSSPASLLGNDSQNRRCKMESLWQQRPLIRAPVGLQIIDVFPARGDS